MFPKIFWALIIMIKNYVLFNMEDSSYDLEQMKFFDDFLSKKGNCEMITRSVSIVTKLMIIALILV